MKNMTQSQYQETTTKLSLNKIEAEPALQSRVVMNPSKVADYQKAYNNGAEFPPLLVAKQTDKNGWTRYRLLDGWHRYQALVNNRTSPKVKVAVRVLEMPMDTSLHMLRFLGGRENIKNGLGLTSKDKRVLFISYVRGKYNQEGNNYKSYRSIASDLSLVPHQTIARWMQSDFPSIARAMSKEHGDGDIETQSHGEGTGFRLTDLPDLSSRERDMFAMTVIEEAKASDNDIRGEIIRWATQLVEVLEREAPHQEHVPFSDPNDTDRF
jgi:hypothetical protein